MVRYSLIVSLLLGVVLIAGCEEEKKPPKKPKAVTPVVKKEPPPVAKKEPPAATQKAPPVAPDPDKADKAVPGKGKTPEVPQVPTMGPIDKSKIPGMPTLTVPKKVPTTAPKLPDLPTPTIPK